MTLIDDGSRFVPWSNDQITGLEHIHRYHWAQTFVANKRVLDIASGEGYGSALLAQTAQHVTSVDLDIAALKHAHASYQRPNLTFIQADAEHFALAPHSIDVVVCFETLEHLNAHDSLLTALKTALTEDGVLLISTPNKQVYTDDVDFHNPHHVRELYHDQFETLLKHHFAQVNIFGQAVIFGSVLSHNQDGIFLHQAQQLETNIFEQTDEHHITLTDSKLAPRYFVACCSHRPVSQGLSNLLMDSQASAISALTDLTHALNDSTAYARKVEDSLDSMKTAEYNARDYIAQQLHLLNEANSYARRLEAQNADLHKTYDETVTYTRQLETKVADLEAYRVNLQPLYDNAVSYARNLEESNRNLEAEHTKLQALYDSAVSYARNLEESNRNLEAEHTKLQALYDSAVSYTRNLEESNRNLETEHTKLQALYDGAVSYARELETKIPDVESSHASLQKLYAEAVNYARDLETKLTSLEEGRGGLQQIYDDAVGYARNLEIRVADLEGHYAELQQTYADAVSYARSLETQVQNLDDSRTDFKKIYDNAVDYARSLEIKIHDLEENLRQFTDIRR
ncbi:MAG: methyltransferase domain-containing protein [Anaerolineae bacterium]|nr:methyltransferase domain-containing protein [Anaerolineae bacterium]